MDGISFGHAPRCVRVTNPPRIVQHEHGVEAGESGGNHLRSAAEAGEEVRFDKASRDADIGAHPRAIEEHRHASRRGADVRQTGRVAAVMVDDSIAAQDVGAQHHLQLRGRVGAMRPGRDENRDIRGADIPHLVEERPQHLATRLRAGDVADRDGDRLALSDELPQRWSADRRSERLNQRSMRIGNRRSENGLDHGGPFFRKLHFEPVDAVVQSAAHEKPLANRISLTSPGERRLAVRLYRAPA